MTSSIYTSENVHQLLSINTWEDNACEREELFKSHLTGEQMRLTGHRPAQAGLRGFLTTWAVRFWNSFQQAKSPTAPCIVALPRRGLCHSVKYLFSDLCRCRPLQHVPQRWQLFFSPAGIKAEPQPADAPAPLPVPVVCTGLQPWPLNPPSGSCILPHRDIMLQPLKTLERNFSLKYSKTELSNAKRV